MGNVAEGLHFLEKWGKFFIFLKILMKFGLKMCNYPLNMMVGHIWTESNLVNFEIPEGLNVVLGSP